MWLLTIEDDEGSVVRRPLPGDRCTLGRSSDRDLVLSQVNVSRRHARFERRGEGWFVVDEGSDNGTFVNGVAIAGPTPVREGDTVQLGGYRIGLSLGESLRELPPPPAPLTPARLRVIAGLSAGDEYAFESHDFVTIGGDDDCSLRLQHENVNPVHAVIRSLPGGRYELCDRSQSGLLFVNGRPLVGEHVLEGGDAINVGGVALVRFLEPSQWPDPRFDMVSKPEGWLPVELDLDDQGEGDDDEENDGLISIEPEADEGADSLLISVEPGPNDMGLESWLSVELELDDDVPVSGINALSRAGSSMRVSEAPPRAVRVGRR
ncbi:MAG: FHA domain-containing protein [Polyangiaceae bacterium]|nr:FHA domain-containing protein [Polyangiaceae bacterium]